MKFYLKNSAFVLFFLLFSPLAMAQNSTGSGPMQDQAQLQKLVAPIALYPDPLLAQILPASTYPLEIVEAARIIHKKKDFSKIDSQDWDPSVKAVAHYPDVLKMMNKSLDWTQQLGEAVLNQQEDVMRAVQGMRQRAMATGNLKSTKQQIVQQTDQTIEIAPYDSQVVYVPSYDPQVVYYVPVARPVINFSIGFPLGAWLVTGFYWPSYRLVYGGPYWGNGGYRGGYYYNHYHRNNVTNINRTTNVYNTNTVYNNNTQINNNTQVTQNNYRPWNHDDKHGNPFNGRRHDYAHSSPGNDHSSAPSQPSQKGPWQNPTHVGEGPKDNGHHDEHEGDRRHEEGGHDWHTAEKNFPPRSDPKDRHFPEDKGPSPHAPDHVADVRDVQRNNYENFQRGMKRGNEVSHDWRPVAEKKAPNYSDQAADSHSSKKAWNPQVQDHPAKIREVQNNKQPDFNREVKQRNELGREWHQVSEGRSPPSSWGEKSGNDHSTSAFRQVSNSRGGPSTSTPHWSHSARVATNRDHH